MRSNCLSKLLPTYQWRRCIFCRVPFGFIITCMLLYLYFKIAGTLCPLRLPHSLYVMPAEIVTDETRLSNVFHVFPHSLIRLINKTRVNNATRWPTIKGPKAWNMTHNRTHKDWTSHGNATNGESCSSMVDCVIMSLQCCLSTSPS